jgi:hypothetical protein
MTDDPESKPRQPDDDRPAAPPGFDDLLRRMIDTPRKPHADMKTGKPRSRRVPASEDAAPDERGSRPD